ncbi:MAG: hypothetical protein LBT25_02365 [Candidatus Symbiothrix sp.]|jgi:hypothetical protein|nr:hypothetical protein [Candidatus Symbiothrix sp.]
MKKSKFLLFCLAVILSACENSDVKQTQTIEFEEIPPQQLRDGFLQLQAKSSSGLPVSYGSWDTTIAVIENDKIQFLQAGVVDIIAYQQGDEQFYEAPQITQQLIIRDWDPNKKTQTISFDLPAEWRLSQDGTAVALKATASSGLPVSFVLSSKEYASLSTTYLYFYHAGENGTSSNVAYNTRIFITASQSGNDEYNPADNVTKSIHVVGDVFH